MPKEPPGFDVSLNIRMASGLDRIVAIWVLINEEKYYFTDYIGDAQWSAKWLFGHSRGRSPTSSIYLAPGDDAKIVFQLNDFLPAIHNVSSYTTGKSGTGFFSNPPLYLNLRDQGFDWEIFRMG
jgi:hypothetical protein